MKVRSKLANLMEKQGISQLALAEATKLSPGTIGRLHRNQVTRIDVATITALAQYFKLKSISELLELEE